MSDSIRIDARGWSPDGSLEGADWIKPRWAYMDDVDAFLEAMHISQPMTPEQRHALTALLADPSRAQTPDELDRELAQMLDTAAAIDSDGVDLSDR